MTMRRSLGARVAMVGCAARALLGGAGAVEAGSISLAVSSEASLTTFLGNMTFQRGPFSLVQVSSDGRVPQSSGYALNFNLSPIFAGTAITSASFTFYVAGAGSTSPPNMSVGSFSGTSGVLTAANVSTGTFIGNAQGLFNTPSPTGENIRTTLDVTSFIQGLINSGTPFAGFAFSAGQAFNNVKGSALPDGFVPVLAVPCSTTPQLSRASWASASRASCACSCRGGAAGRPSRDRRAGPELLVSLSGSRARNSE